MIFPLAAIVFAALSYAQSTSTASTPASPAVTELSDCHLHGNVQYCVPLPAGDEIAVTTASSAAAATALPEKYTGCHNHGGEVYCLDPSGEEVFVEALSSITDGNDEDGQEHEDEDEDEDEEPEEEQAPHSSGGRNCHFHAGVEHCVGGDGSDAPKSCSKIPRTYNIPLRVGSIFVVLVTSALAVFLPLLLHRFANISSSSIVFTVIKQFGTGVIISTAFVHLLTHAELMFSNECVGELAYEATTTSIAMAGLFIAFIVEYGGHRFIDHRAALKLAAAAAAATPAVGGEATSSGTSVISEKNVSHLPLPAFVSAGDDKLSVFVMELGIIFHSILIGITLVVAGDSGFPTLLIVIVFHQGFEGLALGARISNLPPVTSLDRTKISLGALFSFITPIGMAIGIGVRDYFNGSNRETLIALGTLDAFSAGILAWVGLVEMWAKDWLFGDMKNAPIGRTAIAFASLVSGMVLMGVLGKWA